MEKRLGGVAFLNAQNGKRGAAHPASSLTASLFSKRVSLSAALGSLIVLVICSGTDHNQEHLPLMAHQLVDHPQAGSLRLDLQKAGEIGTVAAA